MGVQLGADAKKSAITTVQPYIEYTEKWAFGRVELSVEAYARWIENMNRRWTEKCRYPGPVQPEIFINRQMWQPYTKAPRPEWWAPSSAGKVVRWYSDTGSITGKYDDSEGALYLIIFFDIHLEYCRFELLETPVPKAR
ncbi:MAG: hypothetical protein ABIQ99_10570 [Thermoflexales bacterium]